MLSISIDLSEHYEGQPIASSPFFGHLETPDSASKWTLFYAHPSVFHISLLEDNHFSCDPFHLSLSIHSFLHLQQYKSHLWVADWATPLTFPIISKKDTWIPDEEDQDPGFLTDNLASSTALVANKPVLKHLLTPYISVSWSSEPDFSIATNATKSIPRCRCFLCITIREGQSVYDAYFLKWISWWRSHTCRFHDRLKTPSWLLLDLYGCQPQHRVTPMNHIKASLAQHKDWCKQWPTPRTFRTLDSRKSDIPCQVS